MRMVLLSLMRPKDMRRRWWIGEELQCDKVVVAPAQRSLSRTTRAEDARASWRRCL
jgi:hypothetical protein